jgi:hypothetical protein
MRVNIKMNQTKQVYIFVIISCILFLAFSIGLMHNPSGIQRQIFSLGMNDFFADFFNFQRYISERDPYFNPINGYGEKVFLPFAYLILYPFSKLDSYSTMTLQEIWNSKICLMSVFIFTFFSIGLFLVALNQIIKKYSLYPVLLISLILSYIFFSTIERGNTIMLSAAFICFFISYYDSEDNYKRILAIVSLALAATLKVYPVLFGFLYFEKKQYKEVFLSATITLILTFLPFLFFKRGFSNIPQLINNLKANIENYNFTKVYPRFSFPHLVFIVFNGFFKKSGEKVLFLCNIAKIIIGAASFISIIFSLMLRNKWSKISLLTLAVIFLPVNSGLYCGLYLFPMIILFFATQEERSKIFNIFIFVVFIMVLNPFQIAYNNISLNYIIINVVLLSLWLLLLVDSGKQIFLHYKTNGKLF